MKLQNKKAIITGGGRGIGRAVALAFAREGADVVINYRSNDAAAKEVVDEIQTLDRKAAALKADVGSYQDARLMIDQAVGELGGLDILVNNAGVSRPALLLKMDEETWDQVVDIHLKGTFNCTQAAANHMKENKYGKVINVISTAGLYGTVGQINYASAKAGIIGFTKSASRELARYSINVNAISMGIITTEMTDKVRGDEKLREVYLSRIQLGRFGEPEDVAPAFVFLASDDARYITGQVLSVDGGYVG
jgi:3-oxoacyl-[acyl-carrier protein] reductase